MPRSLLSRLSGLDSSLPADPMQPTTVEITRIKTGMLQLLRDTGATPAHWVPRGESAARECDPNWEKDIANIIDRCIPHTIFAKAASGLFVAETVIVKPATIRAEVDDYGEICAWIYEES